MNFKMPPFIDLTDQRFGRWTVIKKASFVGYGKKPCVYWMCRCDCGAIRDVMGSSLRAGVSVSCGCFHQDRIAETSKYAHRTHGGSRRDRLYRIWRGMIDRCYYPTHNRYYVYGEKGVYVCEEWKNDYSAFRDWALAHGYDENAKRGKCTIDRIDVDGPYAPWNCRWVDMKIQANNKRNQKQEVAI